jgi:tetrahydromethanopterin S-methyltransferase subunit G
MADNTEAILAAIGALRNENTARFDKVDGRLDNMERTDNLIKGEVQLLGARVGSLESRVARIDSDHAATKRTSIEGDEAQQAALVSAMDIHGKALAAVAKRVDDIADRPDTAETIIAEVKQAAKTPTGQKVLGALVTLLLVFMGYLTVKMEQAVKRVEAAPVVHQEAK